jgi:acyl carrier protein
MTRMDESAGASGSGAACPPDEQTTEANIKTKLKAWIASQHEDLSVATLSDDTPLITARLLTSLQVLDLLLYLESLGARSLSPSLLRPAVFHSVATIYAAFFSPGSNHD